MGVPTARPLLGWFSTAKFHFGAGWGNRTPDHSLENCYFAIKLIPPSPATAGFGGQCPLNESAMVGFE